MSEVCYVVTSKARVVDARGSFCLSVLGLVAAGGVLARLVARITHHCDTTTSSSTDVSVPLCHTVTRSITIDTNLVIDIVNFYPVDKGCCHPVTVLVAQLVTPVSQTKLFMRRTKSRRNNNACAVGVCG